MSETRCIFPGSFDPVTIGHIDLIERASRMFGDVVVTVMINVAKKGCFPVEQRVEMLKKACAKYPNVRVLAYSGLTADLARQEKAQFILRGIRDTADAEAEIKLARANRLLYPDAETVLLCADPQKEIVSSSFVREIAAFGGDVSPFVPHEVLGDIVAHFQSLTNQF